MESAAAGVDLVLPPTMTGSAIVPLVVRLMRGDRTPVVPPEPPRPTPIAAPPAAPVTPPPPMPRPAARRPGRWPACRACFPRRPRRAPVEPPKRYATAAAANGPSTWKTTPVTAPAAARRRAERPICWRSPAGCSRDRWK